MIPISARWLSYGLPFRRPWEAGGRRIDGRRGQLLRLDAADGRIGWGDCAPLPEAGIDEASAMRYAEECAALDLEAQAAGTPLASFLAGSPAASEIPVNAILGAVTAATPEDIVAACKEGYSVLKFKVGCTLPATENRILQHLAEALPAGCRLRLDANDAWDEITAVEFLAACERLPVESLEEPLRDPDPAALDRLQEGTRIALALDESLARLPVPELLARSPVRRLVLKPARHGGMRATLALARQARDAGITCVVTSALESACGLLAAAHLAAAVAAGSDREVAHGLATAGWFATDTGTPPPVAGGRLRLPDRPGLGFVPVLS